MVVQESVFGREIVVRCVQKPNVHIPSKHAFIFCLGVLASVEFWTKNHWADAWKHQVLIFAPSSTNRDVGGHFVNMC